MSELSVLCSVDLPNGAILTPDDNAAFERSRPMLEILLSICEQELDK